MRLWSLVPGAHATDHEAEASAADDADAAPARHARDSYQDTDTALTARRDRL